MIYLIVLIYIIYLAVKYPRLNVKGQNAYRFLFLIFVLIAGLRYNLGLDTYAYTSRHETFPTLFQLDNFYIKNIDYQLFWILFESTIRTLSSSFYLLQLILAFFVNFIVFKTIKKYSINPFFTILLYYLLFYLNLNMEILRESISICLLLIGIEFINEKKYIKYFLLSLIAFLFHESAMVLFIVPFMLNIKLSKTMYFVVIAILLSISGLFYFYFLQGLSNINFLLSLTKSEYYSSFTPSSDFPLFNYIKYVLMPATILFLFFNKLNQNERNYIFIYIVFSILFIQIFIFYRIRDYFLILFLISVTNGIIKGIGDKSNKLFLKGALIFIFLYISLFRYYYYDQGKDNYQLYLNYYPYNSLFNEEIPKSRMDNYYKVRW